MLSPVRLSSVCRLSVVCNARAPHSGGWNFRQYFYGIWYLGHPLTSTENFMKIVPGEPLRRGSSTKEGAAKYSDFGPIEGYISETVQDRGKLVLITNRKLHMSFRLVPTYRWPWMTSNGVMAVILRYISDIGSFRGALRKSSWRYTQSFCDRNVAQSF